MLVRRWTVLPPDGGRGPLRVPVPHTGPARVLHSRETEDAGRRGCTPLVLVHGAGTTSRYFNPLLHLLDGTIPAAAVELPGIGSSPPIDIPRDVAGLGDVLADWLRTTGRVPAILVGNSMGCQIVVETAIRHPELVEELVLVGPTVDGEHRSFFRQTARLLVDATLERPSLIATVLTDSLLTNRRAVLRYIRAALDHRPERRTPLVTHPVTVVRGERDPMVPRRWARRLAELAPRGRFVEIEGGAHGTHHGRPEALFGILLGLRHSSSVGSPTI